MIKSKWSYLDEKIQNLYQGSNPPSYSEAARSFLGIDKQTSEAESLRKYISNYVNFLENTSDTEEYEEEVDTDALKVYCKEHNIDYSQVKSAKFVNHQGQGAFNIVLHTDREESFNWNEAYEEAKALIQTAIEANEAINLVEEYDESKSRIGVLKLSDLHIGAFVQNLQKADDYSTIIIATKLLEVAEIVNSLNYDVLHVHIHGDLVESITGLNHPNSWKSMEHGMYGATVIQYAVQILHDCILSKLDNLGEVKIVSGNHDRLTSSKKEDDKGEAAQLIAWGLGLIGYSVEYNPLVIGHLVDNIYHVILHGDKGISKKKTKEIIWDYGRQGYYNYIGEGHLHSRFVKASVNKATDFEVLVDDGIDCQRRILAPLFVGNFYAVSNGWTSNSGFTVVEDNGKGKPNTFDFSI